ncbi:MAG: NADP-dependent phosphogluconate dehydrogenase [Actinomycetota bacterium]|nr:NADP-dependent phosphogluconate dehydrogenase [Actinomycetota bacterium]
MRFAIVGLGRMGISLGQLAAKNGHEVIGWDPDDSARSAAADAGLQVVDDLDTVPAQLESPRVVLMWVPHGQPVDDNLDQLLPHLQAGDVLADMGNSFWEDSRARHERVADTGVHFLDIGTSGGIAEAPGWSGAAFMAGGPREGFDVVAPLLRSMAVDDQAVFYAGPSSSGHFVKLVHNAIEFGMVQAIAEGVELLRRFDHELDLPALFEHWNHGTVIRSWLVELMGHGLRDGGIGLAEGVPPDPSQISTYVEDTDEVKWVVRWAIENDVPVPVTGMSQQMLMAYRDLDWPAAKSVALLRNQYGGHPIHRRSDDEERT